MIFSLVPFLITAVMIGIIETVKCYQPHKVINRIILFSVTDLPEQDAQDEDLHSCPICNRKFRSDVYQKHVAICEKTAAKKRKTFGMLIVICDSEYEVLH